MEKYSFRLKGALGAQLSSSDIVSFLGGITAGMTVVVEVSGEVHGPNLEAAAVVNPLLDDFRLLCPGGVEHEFKRVRQPKAKTEAGPAE